MHNLLYTNSNPNPSRICDMCLPFIGFVFEPGAEPPLPAHPGCYCSYFPTDQEPTTWSWDDMPPAIRHLWMLLAAWFLRQAFRVLPQVLEHFREEAEKYNRQREEEAEEEEQEELLPMSSKTDEQTPSTIQSGRVLLAPTLQEGRREYECVFIRPGRVRRVDGELSNWLIPALALQEAAPLFNAVASYLDHPALFGFGWHQDPSVRDLIGVTFDAQWSDAEKAIVGDLRLYDANPGSPGAMIGDLLDQMLQDEEAGREVPAVGLSAVFWHRDHLDEESGYRITDEIFKVDEVDIVYSPGAGGYVRSALAAKGWSNRQQGCNPRPHIILPEGAPAVGVPNSPLGGKAMSEEKSTTPPAEGQITLPQESTASFNARVDKLLAQITLSEQLDEINAKLAQFTAVATPPPPGDVAPVTIWSQSPIPDSPIPDSLSTRLSTIEQQLGLLIENGTIQDMGTPPRSVVRGMRTGMDQVELALDAMLAGVRPPDGVRPLSGVRELYMLLSGDFEMSGRYRPEQIYLANVTSSTMAGLVANRLNKLVMISFAEYPKWWVPIVSVQDFASLNDVRWITLGGVGELPTVSAGAAYTELTWDDLTQIDSFSKRGGYLGLTLEAIDKDDTRQLIAAPRALAQAAWLTLSKAISNIFTSNSGVGPNVYYDDSSTRALFHSSNSNLGSSPLSPAAWQATRVAMRKQAEHHSGERLGALTAPRFLLVPNDLEFLALQIIGTEHIRGSADYNINPEAEGNEREDRLAAARERVIVIDLWTETADWAAVANPQLYPSIGLGFRFGRVPEIFSVASPTAGLMFSNDVMPIKVRYFFATGPIDFRGVYKHNP